MQTEKLKAEAASDQRDWLIATDLWAPARKEKAIKNKNINKQAKGPFEAWSTLQNKQTNQPGTGRATLAIKEVWQRIISARNLCAINPRILQE
jgi:hypothetical protein